MRDARGQARRFCRRMEDSVGYSFCHPRGVGVGKDCLFLFLQVVAPPWYLVREYLILLGQSRTVMVLLQISRRVVLKFLPLV